MSYSNMYNSAIWSDALGKIPVPVIAQVRVADDVVFQLEVLTKPFIAPADKLCIITHGVPEDSLLYE